MPPGYHDAPQDHARLEAAQVSLLRTPIAREAPHTARFVLGARGVILDVTDLTGRVWASSLSFFFPQGATLFALSSTPLSRPSPTFEIFLGFYCVVPRRLTAGRTSFFVSSQTHLLKAEQPFQGQERSTLGRVQLDAKYIPKITRSSSSKKS